MVYVTLYNQLQMHKSLCLHHSIQSRPTYFGNDCILTKFVKFPVHCSEAHLAYGERQVSAGHLEDSLAAGQEIQLLFRQAHMHSPLQDPHCGRDGPLGSHYGLHLFGSAVTSHSQTLIIVDHNFAEKSLRMLVTAFQGKFHLLCILILLCHYEPIPSS